MTPTDGVLALVPALLLVWLAYDVAVAVRWRRRFGWPTLTHRIQALSRRYPAIPFLAGLVFGLIAGHLFGQF